MFLIAPAAIAAIASAVPAIIKGIKGISQTIKGKKLSETAKPEYVRSGEVDQLIANARNQAAGNKMVGQSEANEQMEADIAGMLREAQKTGSPDDFMTTLTQLASQKSKAVRDLTVSAARDYQQRQQRLTSALKIGAEESGKEFDINLMQPYLASQAAASALRQAGSANIYGAASDLSNTAIQSIDISRFGDGTGGGGGGSGGTDLSLDNIPFR